jgi:hypothetical protein
MENVNTFYVHLEYMFYGHLVYFMSIWCILCPFGNLVVIWYIFSPFWYIVSRKNLATLLDNSFFGKKFGFKVKFLLFCPRLVWDIFVCSTEQLSLEMLH